MGLGQRLYLAAWASTVLPQSQQFADLIQREPEVSGLPNEAQGADLLVGVLAVTCIGSQSAGEEPHAFIVPDHLGRHARGLGRIPDVHVFAHPAAPCELTVAGLVCCGNSFSIAPRQRRSKSALAMTLRLLSAMAAPAMTGLSMPSAASGMPRTL